MKKLIVIIFALFISQQSHASLLSFTATSDVDDPVFGWLDDFADGSGVPDGCCTSLEANVTINTNSPGFSVVGADSYTYTYENAATVSVSASSFTDSTFFTNFTNVDIVIQQYTYSFPEIQFRAHTQTGIDDNYTYFAGFSLILSNSTMGINENNLLESIIGDFNGFLLSYSESKFILDPTCTFACSSGFTAQNGGGVSISPIAVSAVPIPGAAALFLAGLVSLFSFKFKRSVKTENN